MGVSEGGEGEDKEGVKEEVEDVQGSHAHPRPWDLLWSHGPPQGLQVGNHHHLQHYTHYHYTTLNKGTAHHHTRHQITTLIRNQRPPLGP